MNPILQLPGRGAVVWGARTLAGDNPDWRYLHLRRTTIMLQQSILHAMSSFVFHPNDADTWTSLRSTTLSFLATIWQQGALVGASPAEAFSVHVGLGETMTQDDVLAGTLRLTVRVALSRPGELVELTFQQEMAAP